MGQIVSDQYPSNVTTYNFTAYEPENGHCEWQHLGDENGLPKETFSMLFGIICAALGIFGLFTTKNVAVGSRYIFCLIFGYGIMSALHNATLFNGFKKTSGAIINLMQAVVIIRLITTLKFAPFNTSLHSAIISDILMAIFGTYPILAHVIGASFENSWIAWLTFDLIWAVILVELIIIFAFRKRYPQYDICPGIFMLVFYAGIVCILVYAFWLIDRFACSRAVAIMQFYGLWIFLMGLTFYYLTVLDIFLQSAWQSYVPVVTRWPNKYIFLYVSVKWEPGPTMTKTDSQMHQFNSKIEPTT